MMNIAASIAALFVLSFEAFKVHSFFAVAPQRIHHYHAHVIGIHKSSRGERMAGTLDHVMSMTVQVIADIDGDGDGDGSHCSSVKFTQSAEDVHSLLLLDLASNYRDEDMNTNMNMNTNASPGGLLLGMEDIKRGWVELNELIEYEELLPEELDQLYRESSTRSDDKLDKKGFFTLYQLIDDLFEMPEEDSDDQDKFDGPVSANIIENKVNVQPDADADADAPEEPSSTRSIDNTDLIAGSSEIKAHLLSYLTEVHAENDKLPCGLDCTDKERTIILDLITSLATIASPSNLVTSTRGKMKQTQAMGEWDLLYTCSHAMLINRSLSGLGRSTSSQGQFQGLRKRLGGSKYLGTAEYIETFGGGETSFEVVVTGEWYFEEKRSAITGLPAPCLRMELKKVIYGPTTNGADQWSSLGPIKLTDFLYLDEDLMILRGNGNTNSLFIYQRVGVSS